MPTIFICEGRAFKLSHEENKIRKEEVFELNSDQEESDTRVVLYAQYGAKMGYDSVRVKIPDSDILFILLHHASSLNTNVIFDTGSGNLKRLLNVTAKATELGESMSTALMCLHALTG